MAQLIETLTTAIPDSQLVMANTDGFELLIPREYESVYQQLCKDWEKLTNLELEFVDYKKMVIFDVNNYLSITTTGKVKHKGRCEFENIPLHKNKSHSIIPLAFHNYHVNGIPVEETIRNHTNIFDFCAGVRAQKTPERGQAWYELQKYSGDKLERIKLSKTVRYFISKKGHYLIKCYNNGSWEHVEAPSKKGNITKDWRVTYFNKKFVPTNFADYNIDYQYYIKKVNEWNYQFEDANQTNLLFE